MKSWFTRCVSVSFCVLVGSCSSMTSNSELSLYGKGSRCESSPIGRPLVPTEEAAKEVYMAIYKAFVLSETGSSGANALLTFRNAETRLLTTEEDGVWHVTDILPGSENLAGGGGFGVSLNKCDGRVIAAGYVR